MTEIWKAAAGFEGLVEVSDAGNVRALPSVRTGIRRGRPNIQNRPGRMLSPFKSRTGYLTIAPQIGKSRKKVYVHTLVAKAFVPGFEDGLTVNHINGVKSDNRAENLEWLSRSANTVHQWQTGLADLRGENAPGHKLTARKVLIIRRMLSFGATCNEIAVLAGVSPSTIYFIRDGKRWSSIPA